MSIIIDPSTNKPFKKTSPLKRHLDIVNNPITLTGEQINQRMTSLKVRLNRTKLKVATAVQQKATPYTAEQIENMTAKERQKVAV